MSRNLNFIIRVVTSYAIIVIAYIPKSSENSDRSSVPVLTHSERHVESYSKMTAADISYISKYLTRWQEGQSPKWQQEEKEPETPKCFTCTLDSSAQNSLLSDVPLVCKESSGCGKTLKRRPGLGLLGKPGELLDKGKKFLNFGITITNNFAINLRLNMTQTDVSYMMSLLQPDFGSQNQRC